MLVVNAAMAALQAGHEVVIYTSHHDKGRCFRDTTGDGALAGLIRVRGDWLPRHLIFGRFTALCAIVRMMWLALCVVLGDTGKPKSGSGGGGGGGSAAGGGVTKRVIFCDGVSAPVPLLRLAGPVLFYCHFPDKLLVLRRGSTLRRLYRWPLDALEELTTGMASSVAVNSNFTAGIFREAFPRLGKRFFSDEGASLTKGPEGGDGKNGPTRSEARILRVLYPPTNVETYAKRGPGDSPPPGKMGPVVSLNRFERKKNLALAVHALGWALRDMGKAEAVSRGLRLIVAGGYDERVSENVEHLQELRACAAKLGLTELVEFRTNVGDEERSQLLRRACCVLYTPSNEHFGIVPVEAMCSGTPVVAVNSGGPLETVVDGGTGFLCDPTGEAFGSAIVKLARTPNLGERMGNDGRTRVQDRFSIKSFAGAFEASLQDLAASSPTAALGPWLTRGFLLFAAFLVGSVVSSFAGDWRKRLDGQ
eukprot:jgi/Undpi1/8465/HiC_scaffold_25.g10932.m1